VRVSQAIRECVIRSPKRQAPAVVIAAVAALAAATVATADPSVSSKQAEARQVLAEIQQIDSQMGRAVEAYDAATAHLAAIKHDLRFNRKALTVARSNLVHSRAALARRLASLYMAGDDRSGVSVILGAQSLDDLINGMETQQSVTDQDAHIVAEVKRAKKQIAHHQRELVRARKIQERSVAIRAAQRARIEHQLSERQALLSSIKSEIVRLQRAEAARQLALAAQARARLETDPPPAPSGIGITISTPEATVAPPSQYGGVVGIAMRYLGTPYSWGGASPGGFDCSGFVMYVYSQVGVSLPHYTGAQWNMGVPVSRDQLEPGDLVFFDGLSHVGIYIGGDQFIHAPHTGDVVKISSLSESWYAGTYAGARRITG
jgi:cell wall-associated NlpC family hydrolase